MNSEVLVETLEWIMDGMLTPIRQERLFKTDA